MVGLAEYRYSLCMAHAGGALVFVALMKRVTHMESKFLRGHRVTGTSYSSLAYRGVVLVGLHCSLACACGAAVGPFVRDCETDSKRSKVGTQANINEGLLSSGRPEDRKKVQPTFSRTVENAAGEGVATVSRALVGHHDIRPIATG
ncbi:hypothetical protein Taro_049841 [Colocasia esculenta]|uniref:Uncharacterized protein n=1 Tax=Colocasia esculenta TaxID=4460 RepID=A0A843XBV0_COLES|nr:hypothetical protein [Colocasia esculenta]